MWNIKKRTIGIQWTRSTSEYLEHTEFLCKEVLSHLQKTNKVQVITAHEINNIINLYLLEHEFNI